MLRFTILLVFLAPTFVSANDDEKAMRHIIAAIETGWEKADGQPFREHFLDFAGARYFESGGQNVGLTDLIDHHVVPEGDAIKLELAFTEHQFRISDNTAWVLVDTEIRGEIVKSGRQIHNKGFQTFIFEKVNGEWKVIHTHSSSRTVRKEQN